MSASKEKPAFEIHEKSGKSYLIFTDGSVEGFEPDAIVINRLPVRFVDKSARPSREIERIKALKRDKVTGRIVDPDAE